MILLRVYQQVYFAPKIDLFLAKCVIIDFPVAHKISNENVINERVCAAKQIVMTTQYGCFC